MKTYREVKCSDRLPSKTGIYFIKYIDDKYGYSQDFVLHTKKNLKELEEDTWLTQIEWWLEEIEQETKPVDELIESLGEACDDNEYRLSVYKGEWWIDHLIVGSGEPLRQWLTGKPKKK